MSKKAPLPDPFGREPFAIAHAQERGVSRSRLRAADLHAPFHGVRSAAPVSSLVERCAAYRPRMATGQFFSHLTAAQLYDIPLPYTLTKRDVLHVSVLAPSTRPRARGVVGHVLGARIRIRIYRGFRMLDATQVWCQLASILASDDLIVAGDFLLRRKRPFATLEQLERAIVDMGSARGARAARLAIARVRAGTDSPMETRLRLLLVDGGLPEPVIGHTVYDADGFFVATPDLAYVRERIAIDYEGEVHRTDPRVYAEDIERREQLEDAGWLVIRVIKGHLSIRPDHLIQRVSRALRDRAGI